MQWNRDTEIEGDELEFRWFKAAAAGVFNDRWEMRDMYVLVWTWHWRRGWGGGKSFDTPDDVCEVKHTSDQARRTLASSSTRRS